MKDNLVIKTERLLLKTIDKSYAEDVAEYHRRNREFLAEWEPVREEEFFTAEYQEEVIEKDKKMIQEGGLVRFWIFPKGEDKIIGTVAFSNIVRGCFLSCFLGYKLDKDYINKGLMKEAIQECIKYIFDVVGLHRIEANIIPRNKASLRVVEKLGFYQEGVAKKYLKINGVWEDHIHMVLRNEGLEQEG